VRSWPLTICKRRSSIVSAEMCAPLAQTRDMGRMAAPMKLPGGLARNRIGVQGFAARFFRPP
jgi:hypothetical protein